MQSQLNLKIKFRESFRPFAPSILQEFTNEYFKFETESPYMLLVAEVAEAKVKQQKASVKEIGGFGLLNEERSDIPAVTTSTTQPEYIPLAQIQTLYFMIC